MAASTGPGAGSPSSTGRVIPTASASGYLLEHGRGSEPGGRPPDPRSGQVQDVHRMEGDRPALAYNSASGSPMVFRLAASWSGVILVGSQPSPWRPTRLPSVASSAPAERPAAPAPITTTS